VESDGDKEYYIDRITDRTNRLFKNGMSQSTEVTKSLKALEQKLKSDTALEKPMEEYVKFIDALNDLSSTIYNKIHERHIECVEDFEVVNQLIISIKNILKSDRYYLSRTLSYFVENLVRYGENINRTYPYLTDSYYNDIDKSLESIVRVKKIIERM
jgi:Na+-transporting NADH:ubiquinone oxidoreductase subunit NqrD